MEPKKKKRYVFPRYCKDCGEKFKPGEDEKTGEHQKYCKSCLYKRNPKRFSKFKIYLKTTLTLK